jgi:hypothetical protein
MDLHHGFRTRHRDVREYEERLVRLADSVVCSSHGLQEQISSFGREALVVPNGVSADSFQSRVEVPKRRNGRIAAGYFGAVAEWFDVDVIEQLIRMCPSVDVHIAGGISDETVRKRLQSLDRVTLYGEIPYAEIPSFAGSLDVGLIPFKLTPLTLATNPVKLYEYAAAGLPTVSAALPEVALAAESASGVYVARTKDEWSSLLQTASKIEQGVVQDLQSWATNNSWKQRAQSMLSQVGKVPAVSVIVLMWNNAQLTIRCLSSILERSVFPSLEVVLVDNGSDRHEWEEVDRWLTERHAVNVIKVRTGANLGFAGGNNVGLMKASGEFLIILNNDTEVIPGWIHRVLRHFRQNTKLGLLGVSTDNIGNEGRVALPGCQSQHWFGRAMSGYLARPPMLLDVKTVAFFCVAMRRTLIDQVGLLDEKFDTGMFEDDDYCRRVENAGLDINVARDIFVHHEHMATFSQLEDSVLEKIFERNRSRYEEKHGPWIPHVYGRDADAYRG